MGFDLKGGSRILVLAPAIDMSNHGMGEGANCHVRLVEDSGGPRLVLEPLRPIMAGEVGGKANDWS